MITTLCLLTLTGAARRRSVRSPGGEPQQLIAERSFIISDLPILEAFPFERVLDALVAHSGATGLTSAQLYRQWLDTQNPKPGLADPAGPHCDDVVVGGVAMLNGFPRRCPTQEGALAATPFTSGEYIPIEIVNRFDMAPRDGANCGQYRMVFARKTSKFHVIFEAVLPNPHRENGIEGCRAVAQFWADLSNVASLAERRSRLETFFFDGLPGFAPAILPEHFANAGGIRTLQFGRVLHMLQFRVDRKCAAGACSMRIVPDALENTAFGAFLDVSNDSDLAKRFREEFIRQLPNLAVRDINGYFLNIPNEYLIGDPTPSDSGIPPFIYDITFGRGRLQQEADAYRARIQAELTKLGSTLTPDNIVTRAETLNCVGCHFLTADIGNGVIFQQPFGRGQHVTEDTLVAGEAGPQTRYAISEPVTQVFVPNRMKILKEFLSRGTPPVHSN